MDQSDLLFSIIIPTYNRGEFLGKTIFSVLDQDYKQFELLIVDDGSTDNTAEIVQTYSDQRISYFKKQNGERASARNFGIRNAVGDYITFLDSDDVLNSNHLSTALHYAKNRKSSVFHLGYHVVNTKGEIIHPWKKLSNPVNDQLLDGNFLSCLGVFIKKEILMDHTFNEDRNLSGSEDYELWLRLAARYPIHTYETVTAALVNHGSRSVINIEPEKLALRIGLLRHYLLKDAAFVQAYGHKLNKWNAYLDVYLALHLALLRNTKILSLKYLGEAFRRYPRVIMNKRFWVVLKKIAFT